MRVRAIIAGMGAPRAKAAARGDRARKRESAPAPPEPARADWLVLALAVAGLAVAGYLTWLKWAGRGAVFCVAGSGCDLVQASRYARFLGVPTALWGAALYAAIGVLAAMGLTASRWLAAFALAAAGVGFSLYLTALSLFVVGGACVYCLASVAIVTALLVALLRRRPFVPPGRARPLRPVRLATYGSLAAVGAAVLGAFVFASPSSGPPGYPVALARHLKDVGGVMYGAYW